MDMFKEPDYDDDDDDLDDDGKCPPPTSPPCTVGSSQMAGHNIKY